MGLGRKLREAGGLQEAKKKGAVTTGQRWARGQGHRRSIGFSNTRSQATLTGKLQGGAGAGVMVGGQGGTWANAGGTSNKAWHEGAESAKRSLCEDARDSAGVR